ncbi:CRISPR-associated helicase Cas3' [Marinobacter fonticola]|uniref:CRISPR-associated helicase Cas3' n=1 Tax=Marinobacter fonticola TaxID=2603215 RepID=UPI0011E76430|nr:CRISPR-associated helicase Cas3' [Marinobacter fonticola]
MSDNQPTARYYRYWGKARPSDGQSASVPCHLLPYHSLDVAAMGYLLMAPRQPRVQALAETVLIEPAQLQGIFTYCLSIHDLGKFSQSFQYQARPHTDFLITPGTGFRPAQHAALGLLLWKRSTAFTSNIVDACAWPDEQGPKGKARRALELFLGTAFGHHGEPVDIGRDETEAFFIPEDEQAALDFTIEAARLFKPDWPLRQMADPTWAEALKGISWHLAGLAVLADWLGSDQSQFPYCVEPMPLDRYWCERALPQAQRQLDRLGFGEPPRPAPFPGVEVFFGFKPTPLQRWAEQVSLSDGPQLFILEDVTGAGKTEAANSLAHRLMAHGKAGGIYFGLPTMATSNAMYARLSGYYRRWFADDQTPNIVLAHGASQLHDTFRESLIPAQPDDLNYGDDERSATAICNQWFADSRKRALLAEVGVGTVDQVLMSVLPFRHQALRLIGLSNKVLIVDEIHACDDYMLTLLGAVLECHAQQGGDAILLTATLPLSMRRQLIDAWHRGLGRTAAVEPGEMAFPLATVVSREQTTETPVETRASVEREVAVAQLDDQEQAVKLLVEAAEAGQCACWIRNTVDDAIAAYEAIRGRVADPDKVLLFHSRFVMADRHAIENAALSRFGKASQSADRAGRILIGTQVLEQSLDICMDVMISDLAPIDLLIQRAGRLQRHCRDAEGNRNALPGGRDGRPAPVLHILAPPLSGPADHEWMRRFLPGTAAVYRDHGRLWLTLRTLVGEGGIRMPQCARHLIESVYGDSADETIPKGLQDSYFDQEGERQSQTAMAQFNRLNLKKGYITGSAMGGWQAEVDIGTRLSDEPSVKVTLVLWDEARETLKPMVEDVRHPWEMSQVSLRQSLAERLPEWPAELEVQRERLLAQKPGLRYSRLWLGPFDTGEWIYESRVGLHKAPRSGELGSS